MDRIQRHLADVFFALLSAAVLLCGALASPGRAQSASPVRGTVIDAETRFPLPFASVAVVDTTIGANADARGRFRIDDLGLGTWQLRATFIGYEETVVSVTVDPLGVQEIVIPLKKKLAAGTTEAILVTAERNLVDVSEVSTVRRSTAEDIAKLAVDDVGQVVERAVGVSGENDELHIRGGRTDETLFRIENVAMKNVVTGAAVGGSFSAKAVESVDVITGGYEAKYGQAISGIVNVKLKEAGYNYKTSAEYYSGSYDTQRMFLQTEGPLTPPQYALPGRLTFLLGVDYLATDTYLPSLRRSTDSDPVTGNYLGVRRTLNSSVTNTFSGLRWYYNDFLRERQQNNVNLYSKFTWRMTPRHKINMTFTKFVGLDHGFGRFRVGDEVQDASSNRGNYLWAFRDQMDQAPTFTEETSLQSAAWRWTLNQSAYTNVTVSHFRNTIEESVHGKRPWVEGEEYQEWRSVDNDTFFVSDANGDYPRYQNMFTDRWTASGDFTQRWQKHHELTAGFETSYYTLQMVRIENPREGPGGLGSLRDIYKVHPNDGAFYLQNIFSYEGFEGHVGIRGDYLFLGRAADEAAANKPLVAEDYANNTNELFGYRYKLFWSPRLAINHPITTKTSMNFTFGHFTQWPRLIYYYAKISSRSSEAFPLEGNLNLDPERSVKFDFSVKHELTPHDAFDITFHNKDTYDYPTSTSTIDATRTRLVYVNSDFSRTRGVEVVYNRRGGRRFSGMLSYEWMTATGKPADPNRIRQADPDALEAGEAEPDLNEEYMPWNRPHRIQASVGWRFRKGDAPRFLGVPFPDRWNIDFFYSLRSGRPYTPTDIRGVRIGKRNSANAPWENVLDMKFRKFWQPGNSELGISFEVRNLLDTPPVRVVDSSTGEVPVLGVGRYSPGAGARDEPRSVTAVRLSDPSYYGQGINWRLGLEVTF